jgi:hypothetical protein
LDFKVFALWFLGGIHLIISSRMLDSVVGAAFGDLLRKHLDAAYEGNPKYSLPVCRGPKREGLSVRQVRRRAASRWAPPTRDIRFALAFATSLAKVQIYNRGKNIASASGAFG